MTIDKPTSTGIGSLPHHNIDAALYFSFQCDIPFLPQIPIRNPWEFMVAQALEGLPGLEVGKDGSVFLDVDVWLGRSRAFEERLEKAFRTAPTDQDCFTAFEPSQATSSGWQPFLWELEEQKKPIAKLQIAGPMTCQWAVQFKNTKIKPPEISAQVYRLVLARALGMCRRLLKDGIQPLLFLDEPGLYSFIPTDPLHQLRLQELKLMIASLRQEGVWIGLHCCSNTHWPSVMTLGLHFISLDSELSLSPLLEYQTPLSEFLKSGGRFSLGVIPTSHELSATSISSEFLFHSLLEKMKKTLGSQPELVQKILKEALYTPACGLALHRVEDAEKIQGALLEFTHFCQKALE